MQNEFGNTALITACEQGNIECATVLLKHRANVNYQRKVRLYVVCPWSMWLSDKEWCGTECREVLSAPTAHCTG